MRSDWILLGVLTLAAACAIAAFVTGDVWAGGTICVLGGLGAAARMGLL